MRPIDNAIVAAIRVRLEAALAPPRRALRPLRVAGHVVGWLDDARAAHLAAFPDAFKVRNDEVHYVGDNDTPHARTSAFDRIARSLAADNRLSPWRNERYAVAPALGADPLFLIERAAARFFGIETYAVHVNGIVRRDDDFGMWIARRSPTKSIDPGMLDNLVGGGIATGMSIADSVVKEAWEEAGIGASIATHARLTGTVGICREQPDGLQREVIFVHDLVLPADFSPACQDGEVVEHRLVDLDGAARLIAIPDGSDAVTAEASLVVADFLLRYGAFATDAPDYPALVNLLRATQPRAPPIAPGSPA